MKKNVPSLKRGMCAVFSCLLIFTGGGVAQASTTTALTEKVGTVAVKSDTATTNEAFVYYVENGVLYRVKNDNSQRQKLVNYYQGVKLTPAGKYLYYMYSENSTTLMRIPVDGSAKMPSRFLSDEEVVYFVADGEFIYYMNDKGAIYRASADGEKNPSDAKLVTDMADVSNPDFLVIDGRIYYNGLKSGHTTWAASKAADGSGDIQWIAEGAFENTWFTRVDSESIYMMINTKPKETQYSTNCMVLYSIPRKGGTPKAINQKVPLDTNSVYSGSWINGYYMYNKDIMLDSYNEYDYINAKASLISMNGNIIDLHDTGAYYVANLDSNRVVFIDAYAKTYVCTINGDKISDKKEISIPDAHYVVYVHSFITDGKVRVTMLVTDKGTYMLQPDLTVKKLTDVDLNMFMDKDNLSGFFYINPGDNSRLYYISDDGKINTKVSDEKVNRIELVTTP